MITLDQLKSQTPSVFATSPSTKMSDKYVFVPTMDILENLYSKVTENGVIIIDDYCLPNCVKAVSDFRNKEEIKNDIDVIDNCGIFWYKKMKK